MRFLLCKRMEYWQNDKCVKSEVTELGSYDTKEVAFACLNALAAAFGSEIKFTEGRSLAASLQYGHNMSKMEVVPNIGCTKSLKRIMLGCGLMT